MEIDGTLYVRKLQEVRGKDSADLEANRRSHFVVDLIDEGDQATIVAVTSSERGAPSEIWNRPKGISRKRLVPETLLREDGYEFYSLSIARSDLAAGSRFFVKQSGEWIRIFNPFASTLQLPDGWSFSAFHLYLTYLAPAEPPVDGPRHRAFARTVANRGGMLAVEGVIISDHPLDAATFVIRKFRDEDVSWSFPISIYNAGRIWGMSAKSYQAYRGEFAYKFSVDCELPWSAMRSSIYSALVETDSHKSGLYAFNKNIFGKKGLHEFNSRLLYSYVDVVASNIRFELFSFSKSFAINAAREVEQQQNRSSLVCLCGEYTNAARDNGLRLFEAMRRDRSIQAWYVIEADCGMDGDGVLIFGTKQHFVKSLRATAVAFSHHPNYVIPELASSLRSRQARTIFLQHGVTALKNSMPAYHRSKRPFDAFVVCSRPESEAIQEACDYPESSVVITGMPRLDRLFQMARANQNARKDIVVFPTWRRGLDKISTDEFVASGFYLAWRGALEALRASGQHLGMRLVLISHPIIERHIAAFALFVDLVVDAENLQDTLVQAAVLVTDYSSVAFDAIYIKVPVIFFTFDDVEYRFAEDAFIDVETELPGIRFRELEAFQEGVADLEKCLTQSTKIAERTRHRFFRYVDDGNSKRVISTIKALADMDD